MSDKEFKISSALKNLIGQELITDEFVAVFELVKNSFDANASKVTIKFENNRNNNKAKIIIYDDGVGMSEIDLVEKWLFVAYSAKREDVEPDYRDKIKTKRLFAGAKGVGRFSADRLGKNLNLISIKDDKTKKIEQLTVNWEKFEKDSNQEFYQVKVPHTTLPKHNYPILHGTILEISDLRDSWEREKILRLKKSLEKLINPNQENDSKNFKIKIIAADELDDDEKEKKKFEKKNGEFEDREIVNGEVKNFLFETLALKTTQILIEVSEDGEVITSTLSDRGRRIYTITETNDFEVEGERLHSLKIQLFQLNRIAKDNFTRLMGTENKNYGGVFLYKNGFRIMPYGEEGDDSLGIDKRKVQGYNRFLGSRDLFGRIEIYGNNSVFREVTSRNAGLVKNKYYDLLVNLFEEKALKRLEKYVVQVIAWGDPRENKETKEVLPILQPEDVKGEITEIISNLANSKVFVSIDYDKDFLQILEQRQEKSVSRTIKKLEKAAARTDNPEFKKDVENLKREFKKITEDTQSAEGKAEQEGARANDAEAKLKYTIGQNHFLKEAVDVDKERLLSLNHHITHATQRIETNIRNLVKAVKKGDAEEEILGYIEIINIENTKIATFSKYFRKTNFNTMTVRVTKDLVGFVDEYLENVFKDYNHSNNLKIEIDTPLELSFVRKFRPIDITIVLDNLLHNSAKAGAKNVKFQWEKVSDSEVRLHIIDDGKGISDDLVSDVFDFGFTTTNGTGLGLFHISQIIREMNGNIEVNNKLNKGVDFVLYFKK